MAKRRKNKSKKLLSPVLGIISFFKNIFIGIFKTIDFIFTVIFELFVYIGLGVFTFLQFIFKYLYKFFKFIYLKIVLPFFKEVWYIISYCFIGIGYILKAIFYDLPKKIDTKLKENAKRKKELKEFAKNHKKETVSENVGNYFKNKFNNLAPIKHYRNKKERDLEILYIDKNSKDAERTEDKHVYKYLARNKEGQLIKGYFSALSKLDTHSYLIDEGYEVYEIKTNALMDFLHGESKLVQKQMKNKDLIFWLTQLSTYVKSGIPLTDSIKILSKQNKNKAYKKSYDSLIYELTMGESFSEGLRKQGRLFPPLLINMIKSAEAIGDIEGTLDEMADYYTQREDARKTLISALTYPIIIFIFAIAVVIFMLVYIIPQFMDIYDQMGATINPLTQFILNASNWLITNYLLILIALLVIIVIFRLLFTKVKAFRHSVQFILMHIPVLGKILIYNEIVLFSKTFASLNKNNILLTDSMDILSKITKNEIYKLIIYDTVSNLLRGEKMSLSFKDNWAVPELAYYMIVTGESTGQLANMLEKVSDYYQKEQKVMTAAIKSLLEPIIIVFLAIVVGGIILAIIMPIFELYGTMQF